MPNWFINCVAAQLLYQNHGIKGHVTIGHVPLFQGNYWYDFETNRLRRHPNMVRQPKYQLAPDDVLALILMPEEARDAYIEAAGILVSYRCKDSVQGDE